MCLVSFSWSSKSYAASLELTYRYQHHLFFLDPDQFPQWQTQVEMWTFEGNPIAPLQEFRVDGDEIPPLPPGVSRHRIPGWDTGAMRETLHERIALKLDREPGSVVIQKSATGVLFEGVGMLGRELDVDQTVELTISALEQGVSDIILPVMERQPSMTVDPVLRGMGITEVVTIGESDFSGSPWARRHNIGVGLKKFNGYVIQQGETFSFNEVLGPVNESTGYKRELVILGERTLPDYGGGLCQISTTAYRGVWEYGFPISKRKNHSFAVRYYAPQGTDATIYPPHTDMQFLNDSPGALLLQTHSEDDKAYYIYYGTRDDRSAEIVGPFTWDHQDPPDDKIEYTTDIDPGTSRKAGERVPGLKAMWYRVLQKPGGEEIVEPVYSVYEARPKLTQIGVVDEPGEEPSWLGE